MKFLAVTLLVLAVNSELGFGQLLPGLNPIDINFMRKCGTGPNAKPIAAFIGPCFNTPTCKIPRCCGIISGRDSLSRFVYEAGVPFSNGTYYGKIGGIAIGKAAEGSDGELLSIDLPTGPILLPVPGYSHNLCEQTTCPQEVGKTYTLDVPFRCITSLVTLLDVVKLNMVHEVITENGQSALCWGLHGTFVNPDAVKSVTDTVEELIAKPIESISNPINLLRRPLAGLFGPEAKNPFA
ncbi:hypothetical protein Bhyg_12793 [Pseudolycoriella hygida]|uniref:Uncharacterized protein n=1 Tax=Pseudolycoriella hygida TaxID=35572 RepID=A0A9Q0MZI6_9DIPT|nr:hypothetical protein Bhyg_12793 [Pseudolycoriella hygida]